MRAGPPLMFSKKNRRELFPHRKLNRALNLAAPRPTAISKYAKLLAFAPLVKT
jgi:hypothetical protein